MSRPIPIRGAFSFSGRPGGAAMASGDLLTFETTARQLGRSVPWVRNRIADGTIETVEHGGREWVRRESVEKLAGPSRGGTPEADDDGPGLGEVMRAMAYQRLVPEHETPADVRGVQRDLTGLTGPDGGYLIKPQVAQSYFARVRSHAPLNMMRWYFATAREYEVFTTGEASRAAGSRYGGAIVKWAVNATQGSDLSSGTASQPTVTPIRFVCRDFTCWGPKVSRDLVADAPLLGDLILDVQTQETCFEVLNTLLSPTYPTANITNFAASVQVTRAGSNAIALADVDKLWQRCYGPCRRSAVWVCNDDCLYNIDTMATTENWNQAIYMPQGAYQNPWPLLKGRPVIVCEQAPALGSLADLSLVDFSQIGICVHIPASPTKYDPALTLAAMEPEAAVRMMEAAFERRFSEHRYFDTDQAIYMSKFRADIKPLWAAAVTPLNSSNASNTLSPFVILK